MSETGTGVPPGSVQATQDVFEQMLAADEGENEQQETESVTEEVLEASDGESDAESEQTEGEEEAEEAPQPAQTFRVKIGGEEVEVPLDELLKGYSHTADYTRKTQAIAEARKQAEEAERIRIQAEDFLGECSRDCQSRQRVLSHNPHLRQDAVWLVFTRSES